jgi:hypothetical protein
MKDVKNWTKEDLEQLWKGSSEEVALRLDRSVNGIRYMRKKFLLKNKNFEIPDEAKYIPRRASKKRTECRRWSVDELNQMWTAPAKKLAKLFNRTPHAVYLKRLEFLTNNPGYIPPVEAKWTGSLPQQRSAAGTSLTASRPPLKEPVQRLEKTHTFKMSIGGREIELPTQPKRIKLGDIELEF